MQMRLIDVLAQLRIEGLATADADAAVRSAFNAREDDIPWFIRLAVGIGAWAATSFLLSFVIAIAGLENEVGRTIFGMVLLAAAVYVRRSTTAEFMRQASVAAALAGMVLVITGIGQRLGDAMLTGLVTAALSVILVHVMPDRVFRFLAALAFVSGVIVAAVVAKVPFLFELTTLAIVALAACVWRVRLPERSEPVAEMLEPVGYGLIVALFGVLFFSAQVSGSHLMIEIVRSRPALGPVTTIGITLALVALTWKVLSEHGASLSSPRSFAAIAGAAALGAGALSSPGIVAGAAVLMLAFDRRNTVLLGLAVIFLLFFLSQYYYSLDLTLLEKSGVLVGSGVLLLAIRTSIVPRDREGVGA